MGGRSGKGREGAEACGGRGRKGKRVPCIDKFGEAEKKGQGTGSWARRWGSVYLCMRRVVRRPNNRAVEMWGASLHGPCAKVPTGGQTTTPLAQGRYAEQIRAAPARVRHAAQMSTALAALRSDETQRRLACKRCQTRADPRPLCEDAHKEQTSTAPGRPLAATQSHLRILPGQKLQGGLLAPARRHMPHTGSQDSEGVCGGGLRTALA